MSELGTDANEGGGDGGGRDATPTRFALPVDSKVARRPQCGERRGADGGVSVSRRQFGFAMVLPVLDTFTAVAEPLVKKGMEIKFGPGEWLTESKKAVGGKTSKHMSSKGKQWDM